MNARIFASYHDDGRPKRVVGVDIDVTARKRAEEHQSILVAELDHRVKNVLAIVSTIAAHTMETSSSMAHFVAALDGRIRSMAATHELLSRRMWQGIPLAKLLQREPAPYASSGKIALRGADVLLSAKAGQTMAMVFHELSTNAAKYGALSKQDGRVAVGWRHSRKGPGPVRLAIDWVETGGPPVKVPKRSGYGTAVVTDVVPYELDGVAELTFGAEGVRCRLDIPGKWIGTSRHTGAWGAAEEAVAVPVSAAMLHRPTTPSSSNEA
jgi:two-component sensor histidine kinase